MKEERDYMELLELQLLVKGAVAQAFPAKYWVKAEIASWSPRSNGHCYLSLVQSRAGTSIAESRAMIWKWHYSALVARFRQQTGEELRAGITVLVRVQVAFSEIYGMSLYIDDIDPAFTLGEKALERQRTIKLLKEGGYLEMQQELALPDLPYRLAVITSATAAGYGDFRRHLLENPEGYVFAPVLFEAFMQGEQAPESISAALQEIGEDGGYDAVLILRGGGGELDLACFDDYSLAVAIATCPIPVITAIGHDKDVHVADLVACQSVKTPTALADLFLNCYREQDQILDRLQQRVGAGAQRLVARRELELKTLEGRLHRAVQGRFSALERQVDSLKGRIARGLLNKYQGVAQLSDKAVHRLRFAVQARVGEAVSALALREARIQATDPRSILALGYVLVTGKDNKVLKTVDRVAVGDRIGVRFQDGALTARVDEVISENKDKANTA